MARLRPRNGRRITLLGGRRANHNRPYSHVLAARRMGSYSVNLVFFLVGGGGGRLDRLISVCRNVWGGVVGQVRYNCQCVLAYHVGVLSGVGLYEMNVSK
jgi:hypothetical protein